MNKMYKDILLNNITKLHTTDLGQIRIKKNLNLNTYNVVNYCLNLITNEKSQITKNGKNYYCQLANQIITINSTSYTIITAKKI